MFLLFVTLFIVLANLFLGLISFNKNPRSSSNKLFLALTIILSIWAITNYFSLNGKTAEETLFFIRMVMFITAPMMPTIYLLTKAFPHNTIEISGTRFYAIVMFAIFCQILALTDLVYQRVEIIDNTITPIPGPGMALFILNILGFLFLIFHTLYKKYKSFKGLEKTQLKYLILGLSLTFILATITNFIFVVLLKFTFFVSFGPVFTLILVGFISYAMIRHRFFDIRLIVARSVAYSLLVLVLGFIYAGGLLVAGTIIVKEKTTTSNLVISTILTLTVAFSFQYLLRFFEKVTDKIFFKGFYDPQTLLKELSTIMSTTLQLESLTLKILDKVTQNLRITRSVFVLLSKDEGVVEYIEYQGYEQKPLFEKKDIEPFLEKQRITIFDDLEEGELKETMRRLNISSALPLTVQDKKIGVLFLGEKASGDIYSSQDIDVLEILAPQLSIAIQNSREYEEIKRFNITLKNEIEKATKELVAANNKLKELDKLKDEFVSIASHELRTPMTAIKSYAWLLLNDEEKEKLSEKQKLHLERTYNSTERLIKLVNDMLSVSRIEGGRIKINTKLTDLGKLVEETIAELLPSAEPVKINLVFEKNHHAIPPLVCDPDKTKEVLINLIGNAMKFVPQDGKGEIKVTSTLENDKVIICVKDNGIGIKDEDFPKLFQKFGIVGNQFLTKNNAQGTGLGLYISKSIIELQGGQMWVESEGENKGASFYFSLPLYAHWSEEEHAPVAQNLAGPQAAEIIHTKPPS